MKVIICGANGRMGIELIKAISTDNNFKLVGGIIKNPKLIGKDLGDISNITALNVQAVNDLNQVIHKCDVIIDFSLPESSMRFAHIAAENNKTYISGVTGYRQEQIELLKKLSSKIAIFHSGNMSLGINVMIKLATLAAKFLPNYDIDLMDTHHKMKIDSPSGTAKMIISALEMANPSAVLTVNSVRTGDFFGEHQLRLSGGFESITIKHQALSRSIFATGALQATAWTHKQGPGYYTMEDMIK
jgi:4-hydroxy-tetrahydrodipicolinate reductase